MLRIPPAGGASLAGRLTSSGGVTITGGQGRNGTGASLRITGTGDLVYNPSALYFGGNGVDLHLFELSWLGYAHIMRPNANAGTAWTQTMVIESSGRWKWLRGAVIDGQLVVGSIALAGADLAATLANLTSRISSLEARVPP